MPNPADLLAREANWRESRRHLWNAGRRCDLCLISQDQFIGPDRDCTGPYWLSSPHTPEDTDA